MEITQEQIDILEKHKHNMIMLIHNDNRELKQLHKEKIFNEISLVRKFLNSIEIFEPENFEYDFIDNSEKSLTVGDKNN